jgi:hypothetical protein
MLKKGLIVPPAPLWRRWRSFRDRWKAPIPSKVGADNRKLEAVRSSWRVSPELLAYWRSWWFADGLAGDPCARRAKRDLG